MLSFERPKIVAAIAAGLLLPLVGCTPSSPPPTVPYDACGPQLVTALGTPRDTVRVNVTSGGAQDDEGIPVVTEPDGAVVAVSSSDITADGGAVFFESRGALVAGGALGSLEVFRHDMASGSTTLVSLDATGARLTEDVSFDAVSCDGRYALLRSTAQLAGLPTDGVPQLFRKDLSTGEVLQVTNFNQPLSATPVDPLGNGRLSKDGNLLLWRQDGSDPGKLGRVLLRNATTGADLPVPGSDGTVVRARISRDGHTVVFTSIDPEYTGDASTSAPCTFAAFMRWDLTTGATTRIDCVSYFSPIGLSPDGRFAEADRGSWASRIDLATGDHVELPFVARTTVGCTSSTGRYQYVRGQIYTPDPFGPLNLFAQWGVYRIEPGSPSSPGVLVAPAEGASEAGNAMVHCSDDGTTVVFTSNVWSLVTGDTNAAPDLFVRSSPRA